MSFPPKGAPPSKGGPGPQLSGLMAAKPSPGPPDPAAVQGAPGGDEIALIQHVMQLIAGPPSPQSQQQALALLTQLLHMEAAKAASGGPGPQGPPGPGGPAPF